MGEFIHDLLVAALRERIEDALSAATPAERARVVAHVLEAHYVLELMDQLVEPELLEGE